MVSKKSRKDRQTLVHHQHHRLKNCAEANVFARMQSSRDADFNKLMWRQFDGLRNGLKTLTLALKRVDAGLSLSSLQIVLSFMCL